MAEGGRLVLDLPPEGTVTGPMAPQDAARDGDTPSRTPAAAVPHGPDAIADAGEPVGHAVIPEAQWRELQRANIERALAAAGGRVHGPGGAAERLGLPPTTLQSRMRTLGLRPR